MRSRAPAGELAARSKEPAESNECKLQARCAIRVTYCMKNVDRVEYAYTEMISNRLESEKKLQWQKANEEKHETVSL